MLGEKGDQSGSGTKESSSAAGGIGDSAATTSSSSATLALSGIEHPGMNDTMFGRGGNTNYHIGNHRFRVLADEYRRIYRSSNRKEKAAVVKEVVDLWRSRDPPGRFLTKTNPKLGDDSLWHDVGDELARKKAAKILSEKVKPRSQGTLDTNNGSASADAPISLGTSTGAQLPVLSAAATASAVPEPAFPAASLAAIAGRKRSAAAAFDSTRTAKEPLIDASPRNSLTCTGTGCLPPIRNSSNFQQQDLNNILTSLQQVPNQRLQQLSAQLNVRRTLPLNSSIQELLGLYSNVRTAPPRNNLSSTRTSLVSDNSALSTMAQFLALREQEERNRRIASDSLLLSRLLQPTPAGIINQFGRSTLPTPFSLALLANTQQQLSSNNQNSNNNTAIRQHGPEDQENDRKQSS